MLSQMALGKLRRGCRPRELSIELGQGPVEERQQAIQSFLLSASGGGAAASACAPGVSPPLPAPPRRSRRLLAAAPGASPPLPPADSLRAVTHLDTRLKLFSTDVSRAVITTLPSLNSLRFTDSVDKGADHSGLFAVLGSHGEGAPTLRSLELHGVPSCLFPAGLAPALLACSSLRDLTLGLAYSYLDRIDEHSAAQIGGLSQLTSLRLYGFDIGAVTDGPLEALLGGGALASLVSLTIKGITDFHGFRDTAEMPVGLITHLTRLAELYVSHIELQLEGPTGGLEALASLTRLHAADLLTPPELDLSPQPEEALAEAAADAAGVAASAAAAAAVHDHAGGRVGYAPPRPRLLLPPSLVRLELRQYAPSALLLGCLELPPDLTVSAPVDFDPSTPFSLRVELGRMTSPNGALWPAAEGVLCDALRFEGDGSGPSGSASRASGPAARKPQPRRQPPRALVLSFVLSPDDGWRLLQPVGVGDGGQSGPAEAAAAEATRVATAAAVAEEGGRAERGSRGSAAAAGAAPHHGRWLAALGGHGLTHLRLEGVALAVRDFATVVEHVPGLQALCLFACTFSADGLPLLAALQHLRRLDIELTPWQLEDEGEEGVPVPPDPLRLLPALLSAVPALKATD
ncbi:hypothetical protein GPECTOR_31g404 [Gonium pectorale]|uniref:Uncharacterized protein n=1 Tax=Gonium pectorale TaxID=33097 RepID=A0A150GFD7_GONPE|nr:hypothetical protein GPECTOR_31g404 [Gonium pectorale]|eukprot:KXZ48040.1 hypothetical protein GPECTOR_31g404 [Gonium pectorale]